MAIAVVLRCDRPRLVISVSRCLLLLMERRRQLRTRAAPNRRHRRRLAGLPGGRGARRADGADLVAARAAIAGACRRHRLAPILGTTRRWGSGGVFADHGVMAVAGWIADQVVPEPKGGDRTDGQVAVGQVAVRPSGALSAPTGQSQWVETVRVRVRIEADAPREVLKTFVVNAMLWPPVGSTIHAPVHIDLELAWRESGRRASSGGCFLGAGLVGGRGCGGRI